MPRRKAAKGSKTAFVLGMPTASVKEVVAAAAKAGMKITENYVYVIRYTAKKKWKKRPKPRVVRRPRTNTKTEFVLGMPGASAKEVVLAARKAGMTLTARYVYVIRSAAKAKGRSGGAGVRGRLRGRNGVEAQLRQAIAELGLARARRVLADVESAFGR
jgi:hypothetical protein